MTQRRPLSLALLAALLLALALVTGASGQPVQPGPQNAVDVLIAFDRAPGPNEHALVRAAGGTIKHSYHLVPAVAATLPSAAVEALQRNPNVLRVEPDIQAQALDVTSELNNTWGVQRIGAGNVHSAGNTGQNVKVAVIDTGIDYNHPEFTGVYKGGKDFVNDDLDPLDDDGHGTHVSGTIAAARDGSGVVGVAPGVALYALKVLDANGSGSFSDIIKAVEWAADNDIKVTNNSYGSSRDPGLTVKAAFDNAYAAGVLHVAAAGNEGKVGGGGDNVGYPARYSSVMAVAATDSNDARAYFSSTGTAVEIAAPSLTINSAKMGGGYITMSGTSMASPHVAGVAALVIAAGVSGPDAIRARLTSTATDLGTAGRDTYFGYGLVNAVKAVEGGAIPPPPPPPSSEVTVTTFTPGTLSAGDRAAMTITGSGFQPGATVTFIGGYGPAPTASRLSVAADGKKITGTLSAKKNSASLSVWTVKVTNPDGAFNTLANALTIP